MTTGAADSRRDDSAHPHYHLVERLLRSLEEGDLAGVRACFAPDAAIWHNFDQLTVTPDQNQAGNRYYFETFVRRDYNVRRLKLLPDGALLQFVVSLEKADGRTFDWPGCIVFEIVGDTISRLEEYVDIGSFTAAMG